jgi:hypothetical protein
MGRQKHSPQPLLQWPKHWVTLLCPSLLSTHWGYRYPHRGLVWLSPHTVNTNCFANSKAAANENPAEQTSHATWLRAHLCWHLTSVLSSSFQPEGSASSLPSLLSTTPGHVLQHCKYGLQINHRLPFPPPAPGVQEMGRTSHTADFLWNRLADSSNVDYAGKKG